MTRTSTSIVFGLLLCSAPAWAVDCKQTLNALGPGAIQMAFDEFDQSEKGWRSLSKDGCFAEAALLIERYAYSLDSQYRLLKWHLAQMHATAGDATAALAAAALSLNPTQEQMHPEFDWNSYVSATMAFLKRDRASFDVHRAALKAKAGKFAMNAPNDQALDRLASCFAKPYAEAYACQASVLPNPSPGRPQPPPVRTPG